MGDGRWGRLGNGKKSRTPAQQTTERVGAPKLIEKKLQVSQAACAMKRCTGEQIRTDAPGMDSYRRIGWKLVRMNEPAQKKQNNGCKTLISGNQGVKGPECWPRQVHSLILRVGGGVGFAWGREPKSAERLWGLILWGSITKREACKREEKRSQTPTGQRAPKHRFRLSSNTTVYATISVHRK